MKFLISVFSLIFTYHGFTQMSIDGTFAFQTDSAKKYSLYIPSSYIAGTSNKTIVAFHPLNTSRWDSQSWRDTLIVFAETNNLIMICPDGGSMTDGRMER